MGERPRGTGNATDLLVRVRALIDTDALGPDGKLPTERELAMRFGVGRRALRRALDALETEGLIWRRQGKGTFLGTPPDPAGETVAHITGDVDPLSVMEARLSFEPDLAALSARRAGADEVQRMRILVERTCRASDAEAAELWDGSLHRVIARAARNPVLLTAYSIIDEMRAKARWQDERDRARSPGARLLYDRQHEEIVEAIAARDAAAAREAMRAHLRAVTRGLKNGRHVVRALEDA